MPHESRLRKNKQKSSAQSQDLLETGRMPVLQAFDPEAEFEVRSRHLPHWRQQGATYFVTFRLGDALPQDRLRSLRAERLQWTRKHPRPVSPSESRKFQALFSAKIEQYLAAGYGACWLKLSRVANVVQKAMLHFDGVRYCLGSYVIMPNHVHTLVTPAAGHELSAILHSWKSYTSNAINKLLNRHGELWQGESFDHMLRDEDELRHYQRYIADNPVNAGLNEQEYCLGNVK